MSLNDYNRRIVEKLRESVTAFVEGTLDLDEIQTVLESAMHLCEDDGTGIADVVRRRSRYRGDSLHPTSR